MHIDRRNNVGLNNDGTRERSTMQARQNKDGGEMLGTHVGKVKHVKLNPAGIFAYCFIASPGPEYGDVFLHPREIEPWRDGFKEVAKDDVVKFDLYRTDRGYQARNVEVMREDLGVKVTDFKSAPDNIGNQRAGEQ